MDYVKKMMKGCETAEQGFETFISLLVKKEFVEKVKTFCDLFTLTQRLKGKNQIDCEYLSNVAIGWCRIGFYPTEWVTAAVDMVRNPLNGEVCGVAFSKSSQRSHMEKELLANALDELYYCNFYIRLAEDSFMIFKAQEYMNELLSNYKKATEVIEAYVYHMVVPEDKEKMAEFLNLSSLAQRMNHTNLLNITYHDPNIGTTHACFVAVDRDEKGFLETVSLVVEADIQ